MGFVSTCLIFISPHTQRRWLGDHGEALFPSQCQASSTFSLSSSLLSLWYILPTHKKMSRPLYGRTLERSLVLISGPPIRTSLLSQPSDNVYVLTRSCSCVGVMQNGKVEILVNDQGNRITPSYVAFTDEERLVGDAAKNQYAANPQRTIYDIK